MKKKILVTGSVGFIGFHLVQKLVNEGYDVFGLDNINPYYDTKLKLDKLPILGMPKFNLDINHLYKSEIYDNFWFVKADIVNREFIEELFEKEKFDIVVNLAAQAGVQYSLENPHTYIENNVTGFINLIEAAKANNVKHFVYASSSSVYGDREDVPFKESDNVDLPISLYAATKKTNELIAHTYSHLYQLKTTGLRFFTVYGPWGRPDMAPFIFVKNISEGKPITVFNGGNMTRDFTFISDIIEGVYKIVKLEINRELYKVYNIGNSSPVNLNEFIDTIEFILNKKAEIIYKPARLGDVLKTFSDISNINKDYYYSPSVLINEGLREFISWYKKQNL